MRGEGNGELVFAERLIPADGGLVAVEQIAHLARGQSLVGRISHLAVRHCQLVAAGKVDELGGFGFSWGNETVFSLCIAAVPTYQAGIPSSSSSLDCAVECTVAEGEVAAVHIGEEAADGGVALTREEVDGCVHHHILDGTVAVGLSAQTADVVS